MQYVECDIEKIEKLWACKANLKWLLNCYQKNLKYQLWIAYFLLCESVIWQWSIFFKKSRLIKEIKGRSSTKWCTQIKVNGVHICWPTFQTCVWSMCDQLPSQINHIVRLINSKSKDVPEYWKEYGKINIEYRFLSSSSYACLINRISVYGENNMLK